MSSNMNESRLLKQSSIVWFVALLGRARTFVLVSCLLTAVISGGVSSLLPHWYASTVTILPPRETGILSSLGSLGSALRDFAPIRSIGALGGRGGQYNYLSILESRSAKEAMVNQFDLKKVYEIADSSMEKTIKLLETNVDVEVSEEGHINITVFDKEPERAAAIANHYIDILNTISTDLNHQGSSKYREFLEAGVREAKDSLAAYEEAFRNFQKTSGMVAVPDDIQAGAKAFAQLYADKAIKEIELEFLLQVAGSENSEVQRRRAELRILNNKLSLIPDLGLTQWRIYRNLLIQARILEVMIPVYEQARLEEKKETPSVAVLDRAIPAERKAKPKRLLIILIATLSAGMLSLSFYALREQLDALKSRSPESYDVIRSAFSFRRRK